MAVAVSPDARLAAGAAEDGRLWVWDAPHGELHCLLEGNAESAHTLCFNADGRLLVAAGPQDPTLRVWPLEEGATPLELVGHSEPIAALFALKEGNRLLSVDAAGELRVWSLDDGELELWIPSLGAVPGLVAVGGEVALVRSTIETRAALLSLQTGETLGHLPGNGVPITALALSADGGVAVTGNSDGVLQFWSAADETVLRTLWAHNGPVSFLRVWEGWVVSGGEDGSVRVWSISDGSLLTTLPGHAGAGLVVEANLSSSQWVTADNEGNVTLWVSRLSRVIQTPICRMDASDLGFLTDRLSECATDESARPWIELLLGLLHPEAAAPGPGAGHEPAEVANEPGGPLDAVIAALETEVENPTGRQPLRPQRAGDPNPAAGESLRERRLAPQEARPALRDRLAAAHWEPRGRLVLGRAA